MMIPSQMNVYYTRYTRRFLSMSPQAILSETLAAEIRLS
jgi:hypothetical protein